MFNLDVLGSLCVRDSGLCCKCSVLPLRSAAQHRGVTPIQTQVFGLAAKAFQDLGRDPDVSPAIDISAPGCHRAGGGLASDLHQAGPGAGGGSSSARSYCSHYSHCSHCTLAAQRGELLLVKIAAESSLFCCPVSKRKYIWDVVFAFLVWQHLER